jgi:uncharacterized RDD family membrane protein YckC
MLPTCRYHPDVSEGIRNCARCGQTYCSDCLVDIGGLPHCAICKNEQLLDIRSGVDRYVPSLAGIGKRFAAQIIDGFVIAIPMWGIMFAIMWGIGMIANPGKVSSGILLIYIPAFTLPPLYEGLMLSLNGGQTLGKVALKLRVVRPDGSPITKGQAWGRALLRVVLSCLWIVDYVPAFFTKDKTTLHDMAARTRVIETD